MSLIKLTAVADAEAALAAEEALLALQEAGDEPVPLAVSRFEAPLPLWRVEAYFAVTDQAAVSGFAKSRLGNDWHIEAVPDENWVAVVHATLSPVRAGRFLVHGPHDRAGAAGEPFAIEIEASEAFGTAHHGSTVGCLKAIDALAGRQFARVLDLGTGSGVLAIAVAKLVPAARIIATDMDAPSVAIAAGNAALNGVATRIECLTAMGLDHPYLSDARFDLILANILAEPLIALAPALAQALTPKGTLILAGLLAAQADAVRVAYEAAGCKPVNAIDEAGWATLVLTA